MDINSLPYVDVDNIPEEIKKYAGEVTIIISRGCQANCSFCSTPVIWGKGRKNLRTFSIKRIDEEINNYIQHGFYFDSVHFLDDNFTNSWEQVVAFADYWKKTQVPEERTWRCLSRVRSINNPEKIDLLLDANLTQVSVGVESASPRILRSIGKGLTIKEVDEFLNYCEGKPLKKKRIFYDRLS